MKYITAVNSVKLILFLFVSQSLLSKFSPRSLVHSCRFVRALWQSPTSVRMFQKPLLARWSSDVLGPIRKTKRSHEDRLEAFEMKALRHTLRVSWTAKRTNSWVLEQAGVNRSLLANVTRNLSQCSRDAQKPIAVSVQTLAENWGVHAKLIYKYQILYMDRITIVAWRHIVNCLLYTSPSPRD